MRRLWLLPIAFAAIFGALYGGSTVSDRGARLTGVHTTPSIVRSSLTGGPFASPDYLLTPETTTTTEPPTTTTLPPPPPSTRAYPATNHGPHSDAWWHGVAICEQGGRDDPYYGYFSVIDGSSAGLSWDAQVALANGIIARYGDTAWAASCVAAGYRASPGG